MPKAFIGGEKDPNFPERRNPATGVIEVRGQSTILFVTVCTRGRDPWLANDLVHSTLRAVWLCSRAWMVGRYVIMPDHVHFFASPGDRDVEIEEWIAFWKTMAKRAMLDRAGKWQPRGSHTRIRNGRMYSEKFDYMLNNPARAGLVAHPEEWPLQGELFGLSWRDAV